MNFYGRKLPGPGRIAGYGWLVSELGLRVPMPRRLSLVSDHTNADPSRNGRYSDRSNGRVRPCSIT